MNTINNVLANIPFELEKDQFYCYNTKNGKVSIGEIIGASALSNLTMYKVNGQQIDSYSRFSDDYSMIRLGRDLKAFNNYKDFIDDYQKYIDSKLKKAVTNKTKYIVNKSIFTCKKTRSNFVASSWKTFETRQEALDYANKGIVALEKKILKYEPIIANIKDKLHSIEVGLRPFKDNDELLKQIAATPKNISEKDFLTRIDWKGYKTTSLAEVEDGYMATLSKRITPDIVKLSDGTLLLQKECDNHKYYLSLPLVIKYQYVDEAKKHLKKWSIKRLLTDVQRRLEDFDRLKKYLEHYEPFKENPIIGAWFDESYVKDFIEDANTFINKNGE